MKDLEIIVTGDGSHSLLNHSLNETYHSRHGARQESQHVFIENGLRFFSYNNPDRRTIDILEAGFGTALNALLAIRFGDQHATGIRYTSVEAFPLDEDIWTRLNFPDDETRGYFEALHRAAWNTTVALDADFTLKKIRSTFQDFAPSHHSADVIFYDAFAPSRQPELWAKSMLEKFSQALRQGGVFVTYCAKGQVKRDLRELGLVVETLPGPPGKKEMIRALKV